jgi:hypothetical protein
MSQPKFLDELLSQKMNRKEFLARIGATTLALVGVTGLLKTLSGASKPHQAAGYGSAPYGGDRQPGATFTTSAKEEL